MKLDNAKIFKRTTDAIVTLLLYILLLVLVIGTVKVLQSLRYAAVGNTLNDGFLRIVTDVLTLFIIIELFKAMREYSKHERIKLTYVSDATILIVMREISVGLFSQTLEYQTLFALSALLFVLSAVRVMAIKFSPIEV